jgi:uncharacterized membrane protein (UPF0136 family)
MAGSRGIAIAAVTAVAVLLSGCAQLMPTPTPRQVPPGLVSCAPDLPGWYVYEPHKTCYPASGFGL